MRRELSPRSHSQSRSAGRSAVQPRAVSEGREELSLWSCADGVGVCAPRCFSCVDLWTVALQASLSLRFSRQEYWSGLPVPPPGPLSDRRIEPPLLCLLQWQAGSLPLVPPGRTGFSGHFSMSCILGQVT